MRRRHRVGEREKLRPKGVWNAPAKVQVGGYWRSTESLTIAPRRSWSETFLSMSSSGQSASQIVFGIAVLARKTGTAQAKNFSYLVRWRMLREHNLL